MLHYRCAQAEARGFKADLIEAIASGYGGCRSKDGARSLRNILDLLRED